PSLGTADPVSAWDMAAECQKRSDEGFPFNWRGSDVDSNSNEGSRDFCSAGNCRTGGACPRARGQPTDASNQRRGSRRSCPNEQDVAGGPILVSSADLAHLRGY